MDVNPKENKYAPMSKYFVRLIRYANKVIPMKKKNTVKDEGFDNTAQVKETTRIRDSAESNCARLLSPMSVIDGCASVRKLQARVKKARNRTKNSLLVL